MEKWKVKKSDGKIYGPADTQTMGQWIREKRVLPTDLISPADKEEWTEASKIPDFQEFFGITQEKKEIICPQCGKVWPQGTVLCTACGTNLKTGRKIRGYISSEETVAETLSIKAIGEGLKILKESPLSFAGVTFLYFLILFVLEAISRRLQIGNLLILIILPVLTLGFFHYCLLRVKGEKAGIPALFYPFTFFFPAWGLVVLVRLMVFMGSLFFIVPGIILSLIFLFSYFILLENKGGVIHALKESIKLSEGLRWKILATWVLGSLINILGVLALGIGLIFTIPIAPLGTAYLYVQAKEGSLENARKVTTKKEILIALLPIVICGIIFVVIFLFGVLPVLSKMLKGLHTVRNLPSPPPLR